MTTIIFACATCLVLQADGSTPAVSVVSEIEETSGFVVSEVSNKELLASPMWPEDKENPPVSARSAIRLASVMRNSVATTFVADSKINEWKLSSAALQDSTLDRWYWIVTFQLLRDDHVTLGQPSELRLIVLMNKKVVKPRKKGDPVGSKN